MGKLKYVFIFFAVSVMNVMSLFAIRVTHGPYLCSMSPNSVTVVWITDKPAVAWVEYMEAADKSFYCEEHPQVYDCVNGRRRALSTLHRVTLKNLKPGMRYQYRIFSKETLQWNSDGDVRFGKTVASNVYSAKPYSFRTFGNTDENVSFVMFNDIHGRNEVMETLAGSVDFTALDFVVFNGDMSSSVESEEQLFADYIDTAVDLFAKETPIMFCRGNHEPRGKFSYSLIDYFPTSDGHFYQLYKVGDVCFLVLDCGEDKVDSDIEYSGLADFDAYREEEAEWVNKVVQSDVFKQAKARIVLSHIPFTTGDWHGALHLRKLLLPVLNRSNIDLMLSGHEHVYSFHPVNDELRFPTIVNDNETLVKCNINQNGIQVEVIDLKGNVVYEYES